MARRRSEAATERLILDSGAVIALSRGDHRSRAFLARAIELDSEVVVPVAVIAETVRGGARDAGVQRVLKAVGSTEPTTESIGRTAGKLLGRTRRRDTVDALIVAEAIERNGARILTGDPDDLNALAAANDEVVIEPLTRLGRRRP